MANAHNMTLRDLHGILRGVGIPVAHYEAELDNYPYIVFNELGTTYSAASGQVWREVTRIGIDHYTKTEWDASLDELKKILLENKLKFTTATIWYVDTKVIHTQIDLSIARDMEV